MESVEKKMMRVSLKEVLALLALSSSQYCDSMIHKSEAGQGMSVCSFQVRCPNKSSSFDAYINNTLT